MLPPGKLEGMITARLVVYSENVMTMAITTEVLIRFLERRLTGFNIHTNVIKITIPKNDGYFERRAAIGQMNTPNQSYVAVSRTQ